MAGPAAIGHIDIMAMQFNFGLRLARWEIEALLRLDRLFLKAYAEGAPAPPTPSKVGKKS